MKVFKEYWYFFILVFIVFVLSLINQWQKKQIPFVSTSPTLETKESKMSKIVDIFQKETKKIPVIFQTSQDNVFLVFDQPEAILQKPIKIPQTIELPPGKYTYQAYKTGYVTQNLVLDLAGSDQEKIITISLEPLKNFVQFYRLLSENNIKTVGWDKTNLVYHIRNEIKEINKNSTVINLPSNSIVQLANNQMGLAFDNKKLYLISNLKKITPLDVFGKKPIISPSGDKIAFLTDSNKLTVINKNGNKLITNFSVSGEEINLVAWSNSEEILGFTTIEKDQQTIYLLNLLNQQLQKIKSFSEQITQLSFSPEEKYLAINKDNKCSIINLKTNDIIEIAPEEKIQDAVLIWKLETQLILIEKIFYYNKLVDKIWLVDPLNGEKLFLAFSAPLPGRIDFKISPVFSPDQKVLAFVENNGPVWLLFLEDCLNEYFPKVNIPLEPDSYSAP